ncbi:MAG: bifunctional methionine sulfoxide reductase B/A protein [Gammaproteobacteria bacterium]|nr:bifunctional methionine sulfoxide reductase B/A protein [Gammaproteobacteria bacterium]
MLNKRATLTPPVLRIIDAKATEPAFSGDFIDGAVREGSYLCRGCGLVLFRADSQFSSGCGWPSFDAELPDAVRRVPDADGRRTEIVCSRCDAHLGHAFTGEGFTVNNLRHCVNSLAIEFVPDTEVQDTEEAIVAGGCFWGVEYLFQQLPGILKTEVGYIGGQLKNPSYKEVCRGDTGHIEAVRIVYDPTRIDYASVLRYFFEIHDPTQADGQGPDHGDQYLSRVFYYTSEQQQVAQELIKQLHTLGCDAVTEVVPVATFWPAETYHQDYYNQQHKLPYCHRYQKRFPI